jgi:glycosyltransferase involved in cell wall biosynthesis
MSVYNGECSNFLSSCLKSIENQTLLPTEIIIVEDGFISESLKTVINFHKGNLNIVSVALETNMGLAYALNVGLNYCNYDLVVRMDTDDIAALDRFQRQIDFMQSNPDVHASSGYMIEFEEEGVSLSKRFLPLTHSDLSEFSKIRSPLSHPAVIFRKSVITAVGGYPELYPEDYLLWIKMIQNGYKIANLPCILVYMRTNRNFIKRRGFRFFVGELRIYSYMYKSNYINIFEFLKAVLIKFFLRLSPNLIKLFLSLQIFEKRNPLLCE